MSEPLEIELKLEVAPEDRERLAASPLFRWTAERADDWRTPPADHITTRYETKKLGDCAPVFLDFVRV